MMNALLQIPSLDELNRRALERLAKTPISEQGAGGVARLLLFLINEMIHEDVLAVLQTTHVQAFLSQAEGQSLDMIGELLDCVRLLDESDDNFKYRISKKVPSTASANETAVRLAALSVAGVRDVVMRKFTYGTGSGSIYVVADDPSQMQSIVAEVRNKVEAAAAWGNRIEVLSPELLPVELTVRVIFDKKVDGIDQRLIRSQVRDALRSYINARNVGESLVVNEIIQRAMDVHPAIFDVEIVRFAVGGRPVLLTTQTARWDERFVESSRPGAIDAV